jgi:hypothetical protein
MALTWPVEQGGSKGEDVTTIQYLVTAHGHPAGVDGVFGAQTKAAVGAFQASQGLAADGIVGARTWPQLVIQVKQGSDGDAVRAVQSQIHGRGDGVHIAVDGVFGADTMRRVVLRRRKGSSEAAIYACRRTPGVQFESGRPDERNGLSRRVWRRGGSSGVPAGRREKHANECVGVRGLGVAADARRVRLELLRASGPEALVTDVAGDTVP